MSSYDYFAAADDEAAATAFDMPCGPEDDGRFDAISTGGIDPAVDMGRLEELLTGRPYEEIVEDPRWMVVVDHGGEDAEHGVSSLTDALASALATAGEQRLAEVAVPWAETFSGHADAGALTDFLSELARIARGAQERGHRLYCWWSP